MFESEVGLKLSMKEQIRIHKLKKERSGLYFVAPWIIGFFLFGIIPLISSIGMSMTDWGLKGPKTGFIGLQNYIDILQSEEFYTVLLVTMKYAIFAVPLGIISAFFAAYLLNIKIKGSGIFRIIYYLPVVSAGVAVAVMWKYILAEEGLLNQFLGIFGVDAINWFHDAQYVIPAYIIIATWGAFSGYLTYLVAMKDVPESLYDSAKITGIGPIETLYRVTIPLMKPILIYNLILAIISAFRKFSEAYILGGGEQGKFYMVYFYQLAFDDQEMGKAIALAWILVIIVMALIAIIYKQTPFWSYYSGNKKQKRGK